MSATTVTPLEREVILAVRRHGENWDRISSDLDVPPMDCRRTYEELRGRAGKPPAPAARQDADPETSDERPPEGVRIAVLQVTPRMASEWLARNTRNRALKTVRVRQYVADMLRGDWQLNGEAIKIAADGQLLDGQHRLAAIVEADVTVPMLVITGLHELAQETMDQGNSRTLADVLKLRGEQYWNPLATACRVVCTWETYQSILRPPGAPKVSVRQALRTLERNSGIPESVAYVYTRHRAWLPTSHLCGIHYLLACVDQEAADDFVEKLVTGTGLTASDGIYHLREQLLAARAMREAIPHRTLMALIVKAWNAYMLGEPVARLTWTPSGPRAEAFPAIHGLVADEPEKPVEVA